MSIKSTDFLKWGFFGQLGRSLGKDVYSYAKKPTFGDGTYVDTSTVDTSKLGLSDAEGHFTYNGYESTSVGEYIGWIIGLLLLAPIVAPIMFVKALIRLLRHSVRFVDLYDCPVYRNDGRTTTGRRIMGYQTVKFVYRKTFSEAANGIQINKLRNNAVAHTKMDILAYFILSGLGFFWFYTVQHSFNESVREDNAQKVILREKVTHWTDTTYVDSFTEKSRSLKYVFPTKEDELFTDIVLVRENGKLYLYTHNTYTIRDGKTDLKYYDRDKSSNGQLAGSYKILTEEEAITIDLGPIGTKHYDYKYPLTAAQKNKVLSSDSLLMRSDNKIYKFIFK